MATVPAGTAPGSVAVSVTNSGFLPVTDPNGYLYDPVGPLLLADTILAFGDSMTAGVTSFCGVPGCGGTTTGYPQRLRDVAARPLSGAGGRGAGVRRAGRVRLGGRLQRHGGPRSACPARSPPSTIWS